MSVSRLFFPLSATALLLTACRQPEIESYRVPKASAAASPSPAGNPPPSANPTPTQTAASPNTPPGGTSMASTAVATASGPGLSWAAPAHWTVKAASAMRKGSYAIKSDGIAGEADLSITAFPGDVGGDLANLNRWRGQIQLPAIGAGELAAATRRRDQHGLSLTVVDLAGTGAAPQRILGAMVPYQGSTWFFKLMGPAALVAKEQAAFNAFLETIQPGGKP